jgi:hypothetical protein
MLKIVSLTIALLAGALHAAAPNQLSPEEKKEGFVLLFNGRNLDGWEGDPAVWSVEDGAIAGTTDRHPVKQNTFLIYKTKYADFILRADVRLRNGNSGIQFRSRTMPEIAPWVVTGLQADLSDEPGREAWGNFYEERGRSRTMMKTPDEGWLKAKDVVRMHDWNSYEILAQGHHIRLKLNDLVTIDTTETQTSDGIIALQLHMGKPMRVEYRSIRIRTLP